MLQLAHVDPEDYEMGATKVFFRRNIYSELQRRRDEELSNTVTRLQAFCRGFLQRSTARTRAQGPAIRCIQRNLRAYLGYREWPWLQLVQSLRKDQLSAAASGGIIKAEIEQARGQSKALHMESKEISAEVDQLIKLRSEISGHVQDDRSHREEV